MQSKYHVGPDVYKKAIHCCVKDVTGSVCARGSIHLTRSGLDRWMKTLLQPWTTALEVTVFSGWIPDHPNPHAPH